MAAIQHLAFGCTDLARQEDFYTRLLGFKVARVFKAGTPERFVMLRLGDTCIELFPAPPGSPAVDGEAPVGFRHLAFEVPDVAAKRRELQEAGVTMGEIIDASAMAAGLKVCFFRDPDGNVLEIMEGWTDAPQA